MSLPVVLLRYVGCLVSIGKICHRTLRLALLNLTRYAGEEVYLTDDDGLVIRVKVLSVDKNGRVMIGFDAPQNINIARKEVLEREKAPFDPFG